MPIPDMVFGKCINCFSGREGFGTISKYTGYNLRRKKNKQVTQKDQAANKLADQ